MADITVEITESNIIVITDVLPATSAAASAATATTQAGIATAAAVATAADRVQTGLDAATATTQAGIATTQAGLAAADAVATAADRVQTGLDAGAATTQAGIATTQAGLAAADAVATAADRVQTGLDAGTATTQAGIATTQAGIATAAAVATAADRVQTGLDATTATTQAGIATTQAGIATTQAGTATTQASSAAGSASAAAGSATTATNQAAAAAGSALSAASVVSQDLSAIDKTVFAATLVDAFLYDTSKDSDGGAWRKRCGHTSWENETLSGNWLGSAANEAAARAISGAVTGSLYYDTTAAVFRTLNAGSGVTAAYRGNTRQFPAQVLITVEAARVVLWDLTQAGCPMWMVFVGTGVNLLVNAGSSGRTVTAVVALNGHMVFARTGNTYAGITELNFLTDKAFHRYMSSVYVYKGTVSARNAGADNTLTAGYSYLVNDYANDVAMTVLPNAPVDVATGLPVPTIAVATEGGVSVIKDDGTVVNSVLTTSHRGVAFSGSHDLFFYNYAGYISFARAGAYLSAAFGPAVGASYSSGGYGLASPQALSIGTAKIIANYISGAAGLSVLHENPATPTKGMVAYVTKNYNSGWLPGDIRGAWLADTVAETKVGGTDTDRSVKANDLTVNGSLTKAAVASGAALVGYSGWSAANYCERAYDADFDFGTSGFCIMGWLDQAANSAIETLLERDSASTAQRFTLSVTAAGYLEFTCDDNTTTRTATGTAAIDDGVWRFVVCTFNGTTLTIYVNGVSYATATGAALLTLNNATAVLRLGGDVAGTYPATNAALALWRATATVPSAEQIKHIYETEKALFEAGAQCCLAGSSNAVTALAYDEETDLLHVGTSYGRSAIKGLVRVASEATPVGAIVALAAGAGVIAQAGATAVDVYVPAYSLREEMLRDAEQMAKFGQNLVVHDFTATASQTTFSLPVGWEIVAVYQQGALKRETTSWTRSFDGFKWSAVLGTGATVSDWISILTKRV